MRPCKIIEGFADLIQMSLVLLYWLIDARIWFKGPRVNVEHVLNNEEGVRGGDSSSHDTEK